MSSASETTKQQIDQQMSGPQAVSTPAHREVYDEPQNKDTALARFIVPFVLGGVFLFVLVWVLLRV